MPIKLAQPSTPSQPTVLEQAAALQLSPESSVEETNPLLPPAESSYSNRNLPYGLGDKLAEIELILGDSGKIPIATLRLACKAVMLCLKQNEDSILQLEPEDQQLIVQGYLRATDEETQRVLAPKKKKAAKKKAKEIDANPIAEEDEEF